MERNVMWARVDELGLEHLRLVVDGQGAVADGPLLGSKTMWPLGHAIDLAATPFTGTLAIRRLALAPGESAEPTVAYIVVPAPALSASKQRSTCLEARADGGLHKYVRSVPRGFSAAIPVDQERLVIDHPETLRRVWPR